MFADENFVRKLIKVIEKKLRKRRGKFEVTICDLKLIISDLSGHFEAEFGDEGEGVAGETAGDAGRLFGLVTVGGELLGNAVTEKEEFCG